MNKDEILAALPNLSQDDLKDVCTVASSLLGGGTALTGFGATPLARAAFDALTGALNVNMSLEKALQGARGKAFAQKTPILAAWLTVKFEGWDKNQLVQLAFMRMIFELLAADLKRLYLPLAFGVAVQHFDRIPKIIASEYPGYLESNLGRVILSKFTMSEGEAPLGQRNRIGKRS